MKANISENVMESKKARSASPVRNRRIVGQMVKRGSAAEQDFNRKFWQQAGHEKRFEASWEMVREVAAMKGLSDVDEQRLQRSVQNIQRRKS